jgi:hypothetical protein
MAVGETRAAAAVEAQVVTPEPSGRAAALVLRELAAGQRERQA